MSENYTIIKNENTKFKTFLGIRLNEGINRINIVAYFLLIFVSFITITFVLSFVTFILASKNYYNVPSD